MNAGIPVNSSGRQNARLADAARHVACKLRATAFSVQPPLEMPFDSWCAMWQSSAPNQDRVRVPMRTSQSPRHPPPQRGVGGPVWSPTEWP